MSAHAHGDRSTIEIDLGAIERNWQTGAAACPHARIGCVLKHDAYGLGADRIAPVLAAAGCDDFWVAHLDEAAPLRARLAPATARVFALHGLGSHDPDLFAAHRVVPVLASRAEVETARAHAARTGAPLAVAVHLDTGLSRLGLDHDDLIALADRADAFEGLRIECWVTQLVRFEAPGTPETLAQRERFLQWTARLPAADRCIAASGAAFADPLWHLEHVRIGSALYGVRTAATDPPMAPVATLSAPVLRVATVPAGAEVGYGAVFRATRPTVLATLAIGYADGLPYTLGGRGEVRLAGRAVPIVGGVAMGMVGVDVTELPPGSVRTGDRAVLYGPDQPLERLAQAAGVAPNVLLTATASRVPRSYREPSARAREAA